MDKKTAVLLVNLGTPHSPKPRDVKRYLHEFLTDEKVIDIPWLSRQLLVRGLIVPRRYRESARQYQKIWMEEGSPLLVYGKRVKKDLQKVLGDQYLVDLAMRYREPTIEDALWRLMGVCKRIILIPLFPQYAEASTGSILKKVDELLPANRKADLEIIKDFPTDPGMISAFAARASKFDLSSYDHILFSFHGLPERQLKKTNPNGDCLSSPGCCQEWGKHNRYCYAAQCYATARALQEKLGLDNCDFTVTFQSRLGRDPWIQPFTDKVIEELGEKGCKRLLVFCPAFVCDCLETLFEVEVEYKKLFKEKGGSQFDLVPGLNDSPEWVNALANMIKERSAVPGGNNIKISGNLF